MLCDIREFDNNIAQMRCISASQANARDFMDCPECNLEMYVHDTTYSNINTKRCRVGDHTGNIWKCDKCEDSYLENFLNGNCLEPWKG